MDSYIDKVIENAVYRHLLFLGYEVNVGVLNAGEVDFVCRMTKKIAPGVHPEAIFEVPSGIEPL